jgi:hypothetical protein
MGMGNVEWPTNPYQRGLILSVIPCDAPLPRKILRSINNTSIAEMLKLSPLEGCFLHTPVDGTVSNQSTTRLHIIDTIRVSDKAAQLVLLNSQDRNMPQNMVAKIYDSLYCRHGNNNWDVYDNLFRCAEHDFLPETAVYKAIESLGGGVSVL